MELPPPFWVPIVGFVINLVITFVIVRFIYFPKERIKRYVFPFMAFNTIIFFILGPLLNTDLGVGVGFSLFAIFSVMRYRTESMPIREMTYLFVVTALPVMNAILAQDKKLVESLITSMIIIIILYIFERGWGFGRETSMTITYDKPKLTNPDRIEELMDDLRLRTGLPITRIRIGRINLARKSVDITVFYDERKIITT